MSTELDMLAKLTRPNAYQLASMLGVCTPDDLDSPGSKFLALVHDQYRDVLTYQIDHGELLADLLTGDVMDSAYDIMESATPIYTWEIWTTFTDLCAWDLTDELVHDGLIAEDVTMQRRAMVTLHELGSQVINMLASGWADELEDLEAEDDH